jgi:micrococcal nuclease
MRARRISLVAVLVTALMGLCSCSKLTPAKSTAAGEGSPGRIISVADGDTVTVRIDSGRVKSVRLLGIDSPEKYATRYGSPNECGSQAASSFMERFDGDRIVVLFDPGQARVDGYGRLLAYLQQPSGADLGAEELVRGLASPYVYERRVRRDGRYRDLAAAARAAGRGTWGPPCGGDFHSSVPGVQSGS